MPIYTFLHHFSRLSCKYNIGVGISLGRDEGTCCNNTIVNNGCSLQYSGAYTYPHMISYRNVVGRIDSQAIFIQYRVRIGGSNVNIIRQHTIWANLNLGPFKRWKMATMLNCGVITYNYQSIIILKTNWYIMKVDIIRYGQSVSWSKEFYATICNAWIIPHTNRIGFTMIDNTICKYIRIITDECRIFRFELCLSQYIPAMPNYPPIILNGV